MPFSPVPPTGPQYAIESEDRRAWVVGVGGGIRAYEVDGAPVLHGYPVDRVPPMAAGMVLAPWPNRIAGGRYRFADTDHQLALTEPGAGNAIHGLARHSIWTCLDQQPDAVTLQYDVMPQPGYPYAVRLTVRWSVGAEGLRADHNAMNIGAHAAPFGMGVHPYVHLHGTALPDVRLQIPADRYLARDEHDIPTIGTPVEGSEFDFRSGRALGSQSLDAAFTRLSRLADDTAEVTARIAGHPDVVLWMDEAFDYLQVFTPQDIGDGSAAVAIEPMTCAPDAFNSGDGLLVLEPGETWHGSWGV